MAIRLINPHHPTEKLDDSITHLLNVNMLCDVATVNENGTPHINTAFFAYDENWTLCFLSDPNSIHARNIARKPDVAVSIYDGRQIWGGAHTGLQIFGTCERLTGDAEAKAREMYAQRFLLYADFAAGKAPGGDGGESPFAKYVFYGVTPSLVKVLDELAFGDEVVARTEVRSA